MGHLLAIVLPLALGAAWTPTIVAVQVLNLASPHRPQARAWTLAAACGVVLLVESGLALALAVGTGWAEGPSTAGAVVKLVAAALLVAAGAVELHRRGAGAKSGGPSEQPGLDRTFAMGTWLMATNFSSLVLYIPAMHEIGSSDAGTLAQVVAFVLVYTMTMLPAVGPPIAVELAGDRARIPLERLNREFTEHRHTIEALVCFGFAALLAAFGLSELL